MPDREHDLLELLDHIDPAILGYQEWINVGMALKDSGHRVGDWEAWSQRDARRYHEGECEKKWQSFRGADSPVTGGTVVAIARSQGWAPPADEGHELSWDDVIGPRDERVIVRDAAWIEDEDVPEPEDWDPAKEITTYLETLFEAGENVGYVAQSWEKDGRFLPQKGNWDRTAGELVQELNRCGGDLGRVLGDYNQLAGAWIRFNPLDGRGCKNENVTEFRFALVESDSTEIGKQLAIIKAMELPVACLVHSGKKSLHAIVRIDAPDYDEYRKRVDYLYAACKKNGLMVDAQNKNPSRLSRMPGVMRDGRKQFIVATGIGKESWAEWLDWAENKADVLPVDVTSFDEEWDELIAFQDAIIDGLLGSNEKMMLSSASKAGKSVALLELVAAIANGAEWMGARCSQGHTLYINFELKRESRIKRMREICAAKGYVRSNASKMHFLDLRGHSAPLDRLISKIVRQTSEYGCSVIIIDPIYKVMAGDENNAEAVSRFCNQLDALSRQMDCSIIYCHHFSKGQQGQKVSIDRASGSGVFARDADALVSMTELNITDDIRKAYTNEIECAHIGRWIEAHKLTAMLEDIAQDAQVVSSAYRAALAASLPREQMNTLIGELDALQPSIVSMTAWRLESTLRDFAPRRSVDVWYRYPVHEVDEAGLLAAAEIKDLVIDKVKGARKRSTAASDKAKTDAQTLEDAVRNSAFGDSPTTAQVMTYMGLDPKSKGDRDRFGRLLKDDGRYVRLCVSKTSNLWVVKPRNEVPDDVE
jgi:hypothetical protein